MSIVIKQKEESISIGNSLKKIIRKYSINAIWLKSEDEFKTHLLNLNKEIALICNKNEKSITIKDLTRVMAELEKKSKVLGLGSIKFDRIEKIHLQYKIASPYIDLASLVYSIGMAAKGNPYPIIRKLFIKSSSKANAHYVATTYIVGQISILLYADDINLEDINNISEDDMDKFDPIFKLINFDHIRDLAQLLKISIDINMPLDEAKYKIIRELNFHANNKVKYLYNKTFGDSIEPYNTILIAICSELKITDVHNLTTMEIEEKIIMRILQETINQMSEKEKKELEDKLSSLDTFSLNKELIASSGLLTAILGLNATGFGAYIAASSALGAISNGLGITFAFSTYTTMSSVIAGFLGPLGIGAATVSILASLSIAEPKKIIPAVIYIAMLRRQLMLEQPINKKRISNKIIWISVSILFIIIIGIIKILGN